MRCSKQHLGALAIPGPSNFSPLFMGEVNKRSRSSGKSRYGAFGRTMAQPIRSSPWRPVTIRSKARGISGTMPGNRLASSSGGVPAVSDAR